MQLFYKVLLTFLLAGLLFTANSQTNCCNAGFSSYRLPQSSGLNTFQFLMSDSSVSDIQYVQWLFGDGTYSSSTMPAHSYNYSGNYSVTLTVFKRMVDGVQKSCTETRELSVISTCSNFIYHKSNNVVSFIQTAAFGIDSTSAWAQSRTFLWMFGDGQTSNELNPIHSYAQNGNYTACLYQYRNDSSFVDSCYTCQTVIIQNAIIQDTIPAVCNAHFSYNVTGSNVSVHATDSINTSYWWVLGDTGKYYGNNARFTITSNGGLTVCHRQYTGVASSDSVQYCESCTTIYSNTPIDTIPNRCNADFTYSLQGNDVVLNAIDSTRLSFWFLKINGVTQGTTHYGISRTVNLPANGEITVCHSKYSNDVIDTCTICKTVRSRQDTIPEVCYSNFDYTVNGLTITAYVDSAGSGRNVWHFANKAVMRDTLLASYTFNAPGIKRICQTTFTSSDSCTTCKDVLIEEADVNIHPNPAITQITVKSKEGLISSIEIYDLNGMLVKNISGLSVIKYNVNVSDLTSGTYYVSTVLEDGRVNRSKIIIQ